MYIFLDILYNNFFFKLLRILALVHLKKMYFENKPIDDFHHNSYILRIFSFP